MVLCCWRVAAVRVCQVDDLNGGHGGHASRSSAMAWVGEGACTSPVQFRANSLGGALVRAPHGAMPHCRSCREYAVYVVTADVCLVFVKGLNLV